MKSEALARDLADAINRVLMRHAAEDKPAHERVRDVVVDVDKDLPFLTVSALISDGLHFGLDETDYHADTALAARI